MAGEPPALQHFKLDYCCAILGGGGVEGAVDAEGGAVCGGDDGFVFFEFVGLDERQCAAAKTAAHYPRTKYVVHLLGLLDEEVQFLATNLIQLAESVVRCV